MGYEYYPQGIGNVLRKVSADFPGELLVTENGIATENDEQRAAFIDVVTDGVSACIKEGILVKTKFETSWKHIKQGLSYQRISKS